MKIVFQWWRNKIAAILVEYSQCTVRDINSRATGSSVSLAPCRQLPHKCGHSREVFLVRRALSPS